MIFISSINLFIIKMSDEEGENNFIDIEEDEEEGENQVSFLNYLINKMEIIGRRITI